MKHDGDGQLWWISHCPRRGASTNDSRSTCAAVAAGLAWHHHFASGAKRRAQRSNKMVAYAVSCDAEPTIKLPLALPTELSNVGMRLTQAHRSEPRPHHALPLHQDRNALNNRAKAHLVVAYSRQGSTHNVSRFRATAPTSCLRLSPCAGMRSCFPDALRTTAFSLQWISIVL